MSLGNVARVVAVLGAVVAAAGSATSDSNKPPATGGQAPQYSANNQAPPPQQMEPAAALGLWRSTFGAVKIEADNSKGGLGAGAIQGIWVYQRQGQEVVGYFAGNLRGNVLQFRWQEPNNPPLTGEGYLQFDPQGRQYSGRWWSDRRDRVGDWNGWRQANSPVTTRPEYTQPQPYGGQGYGDPYARPQTYPPAPQPGPYDRQPQPGPYDRQPQPGPYDRQPPQPSQPPPPPRGYY